VDGLGIATQGSSSRPVDGKILVGVPAAEADWAAVALLDQQNDRENGMNEMVVLGRKHTDLPMRGASVPRIKSLATDSFTENPVPPLEHLPPSDERLKMLHSMLRIRLVEEEIVRRYGEHEMRCPTHICIGQEAAPAGVSAHLRPHDAVFSAHRSHGHYLAKGADLTAMIAELYGRETGCARGRGGSQHLIDLNVGFLGSAPILASTISVGVGVAWAAKRRGEDRVVVIYFGDGATEEGAFHEALNFAGVERLPVVFACENNLYSVHTPLEARQPARGIHELGPVHGMVGVRGDGNDADEVWCLAVEAIARARQGTGPTLLELMTYRWKEHCGPNEDEGLGYRSGAEIRNWMDRCPVSTYERRLVTAGVATEADVARMRMAIGAEIASAFDAARAAPFPPPSDLRRFVFPSCSDAAS
jgi:TPP-dependent pyruvate/acetoin dehydrogenase alpha subunit